MDNLKGKTCPRCGISSLYIADMHDKINNRDERLGLYRARIKALEGALNGIAQMTFLEPNRQLLDDIFSECKRILQQEDKYGALEIGSKRWKAG